MALNYEVREIGGEIEKTNWRVSIIFNDEYTMYWQEKMFVLEKYEIMWDGHIGQMTVTKHRIDLIRGDMQTRDALYY